MGEHWYNILDLVLHGTFIVAYYSAGWEAEH